MIAWFRSLNRNEVTYWLGLLMLFIGLSLSVSMATGLVVVGAGIAIESVVTSYLATWFSEKKS